MSKTRTKRLFSVVALAFALILGAYGHKAHAAGPTDPWVYTEAALSEMCLSDTCSHTSNLIESSFKKWVQDQIDAIKTPEHIEKIVGTCLEQLKAVGFVAGISAGWPSLDVILTTVINTVCDMIQQYWDDLLSQLIYQFALPDVINDVLAMGAQYGFTTDITGGFRRGSGDCSQDIDGDGIEDCVPVGTVVINTPDGQQTYSTDDEDPVD